MGVAMGVWEGRQCSCNMKFKTLKGISISITSQSAGKRKSKDKKRTCDAMQCDATFVAQIWALWHDRRQQGEGGEEEEKRVRHERQHDIHVCVCLRVYTLKCRCHWRLELRCDSDATHLYACLCARVCVCVSVVDAEVEDFWLLCNNSHANDDDKICSCSSLASLPLSKPLCTG